MGSSDHMKGLNAGIHHISTVTAMQVHVDEPRHDPCALNVQLLRRWRDANFIHRKNLVYILTLYTDTPRIDQPIRRDYLAVNKI